MVRKSYCCRFFSFGFGHWTSKSIWRNSLPFYGCFGSTKILHVDDDYQLPHRIMRLTSVFVVGPFFCCYNCFSDAIYISLSYVSLSIDGINQASQKNAIGFKHFRNMNSCAFNERNKDYINEIKSEKCTSRINLWTDTLRYRDNFYLN